MSEGNDKSNSRRPRAGGSGATARRSAAGGEDEGNGIEGEWPRRWWASTCYRSQGWLTWKANARH